MEGAVTTTTEERLEIALANARASIKHWTEQMGLPADEAAMDLHKTLRELVLAIAEYQITPTPRSWEKDITDGDTDH